MNLSLSKREINRRRWFEHIQDWKRSGLTQKVFCQQHQLGLASFRRWRGIVMRERKPERSSAMSFLPVTLTEPRASGLALLLKEKGTDLFMPAVVSQHGGKSGAVHYTAENRIVNAPKTSGKK